MNFIIIAGNNLRRIWVKSVNLTDVVIRKLLILLLYGYRYTLSFWLGRNCRFEPSCSSYAIAVLQQQRLDFAGKLIIKRLLRCHPFNKQSEALVYDPPPAPSKNSQ